MSRSVAQLQLGSVLNSVAQVASGIHTEVWDLDLKSTVWMESAAWVESGGHATSGAIQIWVACAATRGQSVTGYQATAEGHDWVPMALKRPGSGMTCGSGCH